MTAQKNISEQGPFFSLLSGLPGGGKAFMGILLAAACLILVGNMLIPEGQALHVPTYLVSLMGKYLCYALLALSVDLIWGYCGILSLGHGAFFALGGYAMGMYLMRQIGDRGVYGNPDLPDFMVFLNWQELPWYWYGMDNAFVATGIPQTRMVFDHIEAKRQYNIGLVDDQICAVL